MSADSSHQQSIPHSNTTIYSLCESGLNVYKYSIIMTEEKGGQKALLLVGLIAGIYASQLTVGILEQRIFKVPFLRKDDPSQSDRFADQVTPYTFNTLVASLLCLLLTPKEDRRFNIPVSYFAKVSACDLVIQISLLTAMLRTSYTTMLVVNSSSLLSVVAVGAYCSRVKFRDHPTENGQSKTLKQSNRIQPQKMWIGLIICIGVTLFSYFSGGEGAKSDGEQHFGGFWMTVLIFAVALVTEGFRPDFAAQLKEQYHPSALFFSFGVQGCTCVMVAVLSICTGRMWYFFQFMFTHDGVFSSMTLYTLLYSIGNILGFKVITEFRQHIYPLVSNLRKCTTICLNILWYGHQLLMMQWVGIVIVFFGVMVEVAHNHGLVCLGTPKTVPKQEGGSMMTYEVVTTQQIPSLTMIRHDSEIITPDDVSLKMIRHQSDSFAPGQ